MKKLLYITDQLEYAENSLIHLLFQIHLNKYLQVNTVFFSKYKNGIELKDNGQILVSNRLRDILFEKLEKKGVDISSYDHVIVRNDTEILKKVIKLRDKHDFKIGFRLSFPKKIARYETNEANNKSSLLTFINNKIISYNETNLINKCDLFLPTSMQMKNDYFQDVKTDTFELPSGIDSQSIENKPLSQESIKRFFYIGTFDKLREFTTVLKAFDSLEDENFILMLSTKETKYQEQLLENFPKLQDKVEICVVRSNEDYHNFVMKSDIGISLLPNLKLFNSSTPVKIFDFYNWGTPCLMSDSPINRSVFDDNLNGWLCSFDTESITKKLKLINSLSKEEIQKIGIKGQEKLLEIRNYETLAKELAKKLDNL